MKIKHPKQKEETDSYEIGDIIESPTRNLFGEIVSFLGDRVKSFEVIVLDKRLKPLVNIDGEFKYKKLRSELVKHFDYSKLRISRGFFLGDVIVKVDPRYFRPTEVEELLGDPSKAREKLGWKPEITLKQLCYEMVTEDLDSARKSKLLADHGHEVNIPRED